jgi:hypothetical protein
LKRKAASITLLILLSVSFLFMQLWMVLGQLGVNIYLVNPEEEGIVGQNINLQGTISTTNGAFEIWFDKKLLVNQSAEGYYVNVNFTIPQLSAGDYVITLRDVSKNVNATHDFSIRMAYYIAALVPSTPAQLQEGSEVVLNVRITGAQSDSSYFANVTVGLPKPLNASYSRTVELVTSIQEASATAQITYPSPSFLPEGSLTNYTGLYKVYFNETQMLAENEFSVGFTHLSEYHRSQIVEIRAIGYQPNENATMRIKYAETGANVDSETVTASNEGIIASSWAVPLDALIGDYNITLTPDNTIKSIPDSQLFTVPGYDVTIRTLNLAGDALPQIMVEALDQATNTVYNGTSGSDGKAQLSLETGNHIISAFWNGVNVGQINMAIIGDTSFNFICELTNLKITVKNEDGNLIPFVNLHVTYQYITTKDGLAKTGSASGQTNLSGMFILNSILPGISCTINASLYGIVFNEGNNTVTSIPLQQISEVIVFCPSRTLTLRILDSNIAPISNARIELFEVTSGLFNGAITDTEGTVALEITFGKYKLRVYKDDILLNEIVINVFSDSQSEILCSLCNIQVSVRVVDYFNQPISNIYVLLHGPGIGTLSAPTQSDGTTTFSNVIGGNIQIIAYPDGLENSYEAVNLRIEESKTVNIRLTKYILIGPFLIESSVLATCTVILLVIIVFVSIEVYRRKRARLTRDET